jgi:hypothetical protein
MSLVLFSHFAISLLKRCLLCIPDTRSAEIPNSSATLSQLATSLQGLWFSCLRNVEMLGLWHVSNYWPPLQNFPPCRGFRLRNFTNPNLEAWVLRPTNSRNELSGVDPTVHIDLDQQLWFLLGLCFIIAATVISPLVCEI